MSDNIVASSGGSASGGESRGGSSIKMDGESIVFTVGEATLTMKADGTVTVKGKNITVQGSGDVVCKADNKITIRSTQTDVN